MNADDKLHPLLSLKTGKPIDRFPETSKGIARLTGTFYTPNLHANSMPLPPETTIDMSKRNRKTDKDDGLVTTVDAILLALEADRSGKEEEKRARLRVQIGLKPDPA